MTLQEYNDLYKQPLLKQMTIVSSGGITIKNSNIVSEQMSLEKSLCSETNLRYGRCEAACFKVRIADINHDFTGEWLTVTQEVVTDGEGYLLLQNGQYLLTEDGYKIKLKNEQIDEASATYGRFKVYSDKPSNDRRWRDLTCYDAMYDILNTDVLTWFNGLTFPMTIKNLRDSLFTYLGITQVTKTLINDNFSTPGGFSVSGSLSAKQVIEAICELNGVFGQITSDGKFDYISLDNPPTLTLDYYVDGTGSYEDYLTDAVTGINAKGTSNDVGVTVGTTTNLYIISGNPLIYGTEGTSALTTALNTLLQHIISIQYRPYGVTTYGNPMLPLGTRITINTKNQTIVSYVVKKTLSGIQSLKDTISATGDKHQPTAVNSPTAEIFRTQGKVHELEINVDGLRSSVTATQTNLANNYSTTQQMNSAIQQSATDITTQVSNTYVTQSAYNAEVQNLQDQIDGRIEYWDGNVVPTLNNAPASSWATTSAKDSHIGDLYRYHHGTPEVTDYYRFDKDTSTTPATYSWVALGASQVDEALRLAEEANDKADAAQAQLDALQSSVEDDYYTKSETNSQISQSASAITQSVSSTYETKSNATSHYDSLDSAAQGYANGALSTANTNAQGYANDAKNAAITDTNTKLQNYYTKSQTDSQISQTATGITQSVSSTYETKSDSTNKFNTANTNAQNFANSAKNAAIADTDTKLQSYYTKTQTDSKIDQKADAITLAVSQTYTTKNEFNNLEIGGRNLFKQTTEDWKSKVMSGTSNESFTLNGDGSNVTSDNVCDAVALGLKTDDVIQISADIKFSSDFAPVSGQTQNQYIQGNCNYGGTWSSITITGGNLPSVLLAIINSTSKEGHINTYFKVPSKMVDSTTSGKFYLSIRFDYWRGTVYLKNVMVEKATKPSDWTPAPEDAIDYVDNQLTQYYTKAQIDVTTSSITSSVQEIGTKVDNINVGGTNYFRNAKIMDDWNTGSRTTRIDGSDGFSIMKLTGSSENWSASFTTGKTLSPELLNGSPWILSFEYSCTTDALVYAQVNATSASPGTSSANRTKYGTFGYNTYVTLAPTAGEWKKYVIQGKNLTEDMLTSGSGNVNSWQMQLYNRSNNVVLQMRKLKLEHGTEATDWTLAPEDVELYADGVGASALAAANSATDQKLTNYSTKSEVTQLANKIVMKVDNNGNIVQVALSADPSTGTVFTVGADNIELTASETINLMAGGTINLSAGQINITGSSASGSVSIDENGILTCSGANVTGTIHANTGDIGGWSISSDKLYGGADDYFCAMLKPTSTAKYSFVSGATTSAYDDAAFRVTPQGYLYAKNLVLTAYPGNQPSSVLYGKNGIWLYGTTSGSAIWFSDPSTQDLHSTILMMGNTGLIQCKSLNCSGTKKRVVETEDYGTRSLYCYETPSPMFGDIGEGKIAEDGKCYVWLDSTFSETIKTESYQVFLQKYGQGECYVTERTSRYFVVEGDAGMCFGWEIKARQAGFENERLEIYVEPEKPKDEYDFPMEAIRHLEIIKDERTVA